MSPVNIFIIEKHSVRLYVILCNYVYVGTYVLTYVFMYVHTLLYAYMISVPSLVVVAASSRDTNSALVNESAD